MLAPLDLGHLKLENDGAAPLSTHSSAQPTQAPETNPPLSLLVPPARRLGPCSWPQIHLLLRQERGLELRRALLCSTSFSASCIACTTGTYVAV